MAILKSGCRFSLFLFLFWLVCSGNFIADSLQYQKRINFKAIENQYYF